MKGLILPSVNFLAGAICKQEPQPGVVQVVWVSDSAVPLHGCLCCTASALCWSPLLCVSILQPTVCTGLCSADFWMSISW